MITHQIYNPETMGNPHPSKFRCDIRDGGWLVACGMFDTKEAAQAWGEKQDGAMSPQVAALYVEIENEKRAEAGMTKTVNMKFKDIKEGEKFAFADPVEFSIGKTFVKTSPRKYRIFADTRSRVSDYKVGTVNVQVNKV